jgi:integrase
VTRNPTDVPGVYSYLLADGSLRYGAVVDVRGAWGRERVQRRKEGFLKLKDAKAWRVEKMSEVASGKTELGRGRTFGWWRREWVEMKSPDWQYASRQMYEAHLSKFSSLDDTPLDKIGPVDIEMILVRLRSKYKASTLRTIRAMISGCFNAAVSLDLIARNPTRGAIRIRPDQDQREFWVAEQVEALVSGRAHDERWGPVWSLLAETWIRVGEACALRWGDIDFANGVMRVERTMRWGPDGWTVGTKAKTAASIRRIVLSPELVALLRTWKDRQRFSGARDSVIDSNPHEVRAELRAACDYCGLPVITPHMFRHAGATIAHRLGMEASVIQQRLGHASSMFTLDMYVHPNLDDQRKAAQAIWRLLYPDEDVTERTESK